MNDEKRAPHDAQSDCPPLTTPQERAESSAEAAQRSAQDLIETKSEKKGQRGRAIREFLIERGCDDSSKSSVVGFLTDNGVKDLNHAKRLARLIRRDWKTSDPSQKHIMFLAQLFHVGIYRLIGLDNTDQLPKDDLPEETALKWIRLFLDHCHHLGCYVVTVKKTQIQEWEKEALSLPASNVEAQMQLAERCSSQFRVLGISPLLRQKHSVESLSEQEIHKKDMAFFLSQRLNWTRAVPKYGPKLYERARREALFGIFNVVGDRGNPQFTWYPCIDPQNHLTEIALKVSYDELRVPLPRSLRGWLICYHFGERLNEETVKNLLRIPHN